MKSICYVISLLVTKLLTELLKEVMAGRGLISVSDQASERQGWVDFLVNSPGSLSNFEVSAGDDFLF